MSDTSIQQASPSVLPGKVLLSRKDAEKLASIRRPDDQLQVVPMAVIHSGYLRDPLRAETVRRIPLRRLLLPEEQTSDEEIGK